MIAAMAVVVAGALAPVTSAVDARHASSRASFHAAEPVCLADVAPRQLGTMFDTEPGGVVGADYQRAFALDDGRVLWTFQDAAIRVGPDDIRIVHNIAVVQDGSCFTVMYGGTRAAPEPFLFADRTVPFERWFWPLDATVDADGMIHVFVAEMREDGPSYLTRTVPVGTWVAVIDPVSMDVTDERRPPNAGADLYGWSVTSDHDWTYLYAHCYRQFGYDLYVFTAAFDRSCSTDITVARVPRGAPMAAPAYWDGGSWQADPGRAVPIVDVTDRRINANQFEWTGAGFVSVNKEGDWWGDTIYVAHSSSPTGPFEIVQELAAPLKCAAEECNSFFSSWVPGAAVDRAAGELVVSLSHNRWDGVVTSLYRPTFHVVAAPKVLPPEGTLEIAVDPSVSAVALTVTAVDPTYPGFATVYPCADGRPLASNLNHIAEPVVANLVLARPDADGRICVFSLAPTDLVIDLAGEFEGGVVPAVRPERLADTRDGTGVRAGTVLDRTVLSVPVPAVPDGAAVALNVAAVDPFGPGFLTLYPCDRERPPTSNVNVGSEPAVSNLVVVEPSADGEVCVYSHGATDVVVDHIGAVHGDSLGAPARLVDTRDHADRRLGAGDVLEVVVPGDDPTALLNVIAVGHDAPGFLSVYPCASRRPMVSNVNYAVSPIVANLVIVAPDVDRRVCVYSLVGTDVVVDHLGGLAAEVGLPERIVDTRDGTGVPGQFARR